MRKIAFLLALILALFCLAGCGADKREESAPERRDAAPAEEKSEKADPAPEAPAEEAEPAPAEEEGLPESCTYTVTAADPQGAPVAGVMVNFCTDEACTTVVTDENGAAVFTGEPYAYHVQIIKLPKGFQMDGEKEFITELHDQSFALLVTEAEG